MCRMCQSTQQASFNLSSFVFHALPCPQVKLADFGTADVDPLTVGNPVESCHIATLENTPIEMLCCGNQARQVGEKKKE